MPIDHEQQSNADAQPAKGPPCALLVRNAGAGSDEGDRPGGDQDRDNLATNFTFFTDQFGQEYARVPRETPAPHHELMLIRSTAMKKYLRSLWLRTYHRLPSPKELREALDLAETMASEGPRHRLWNRFAWRDGEVWIDLCDPLWRAIRVTSSGWQVVHDVPLLFRRHGHQRAQVEPARGGQAKDLLRFLPPMSDKNELLLLDWVTLGFVPTIQHPVVVPWGEHGAGKSSLCRRVRAVLDPSRAPLLGDDDRRDLMLTFEHHAVPAFDNLGALRPRESDLFCRAVTGGGTSRRKLYTDTDEVILSFCRPILMNGLSIPSTRADFLDRSIPLKLERLKCHEADEELEAKFAAALPGILGGFLDVLARTLAQVPHLPSGRNFRMADFGRWGRAVAVALGNRPGNFDDAYQEAVVAQAHEVIESNIVGLAMLEFMKRNPLPKRVNGEELFPELERNARTLKHEAEWPDAESGALSKRIIALIPTFATLGYKVTRLKRRNNVRSRWKMEQLPEEPVPALVAIRT